MDGGFESGSQVTLGFHCQTAGVSQKSYTSSRCVAKLTSQLLTNVTVLESRLTVASVDAAEAEVLESFEPVAG